MRHSSSASRPTGGFTLAELLVATTVTALLLTSVCGIYFATASEWERQQGRGGALVATSLACSTIADYASQAVSIELVDRFSLGIYDALHVNLPMYTYSSYPSVTPWTGGKVPDMSIIAIRDGGYYPVWSSDGGRQRLQYTSSGRRWVVFYLSDITGSYDASGDILWAATVDRSGSPTVIGPDQAWSMHSTRMGKIAPLTSLRFTVDDTIAPKRVTVIATASYKVSSTTEQMSRTRVVCLKNAR